MKKYLLLLFCLFQVGTSQEILLSEQNRYWKFHNWAAIGYRYDRQQFDEFYTSHTLTSKVSIRSRSSPFLNIGNHTEFKNLLLILRGTYAWLACGKLDYALPGNYGREPLAFNGFQDGSGYSAEGQGSLSYLLNFLSPYTSWFSFSLIPGVGYRYFHLMDYPLGIKTSPIGSDSPSLPAGATGGFANASFTRPIQQDWFGPYFEGRALLRFAQKLQIELFYQYHIPKLRMVQATQIDTYFFNGSAALVEVQLQHYHNVAHGRSLRTQLGGFDLRYHGGKAVTFGLHFEGAATWSDTNRYYVKQTEQQFITNPGTTYRSFYDRVAIHWVNYMSFFFLGYRF